MLFNLMQKKKVCMLYIKQCQHKIDAFLEFSSFFHDPADVGNLNSGSSAFIKVKIHKSKDMETS